MDAEDFPAEHLDLDRLIANLAEASSRHAECVAFADASSDEEEKAYWVSQADQSQAETDLLNKLIARKREHEKG